MTAQAKKISSKKKLVLLADDDFFMRGMIKQALTDYAEVVEVESGDKVFELYKKHRPAVLLLDIHMPGANGKKVLKDVLRFDPSAHVIMITADLNFDNFMETRKEDAAEYFLVKPFTKEKLLHHVLPLLALYDEHGE